MRMALVGSSIHGELLSPNDIDLAIECNSLKEFNVMVSVYKADCSNNPKDGKNIAVARHGDLNIILLLGITIPEYTSGMDFDIVRGYKDLPSGELILTNVAKEALKNKRITYLQRNDEHQALFRRYDGDYRDKNRKSKYANKIPKGWTLIIKEGN